MRLHFYSSDTRSLCVDFPVFMNGGFTGVLPKMHSIRTKGKERKTREEKKLRNVNGKIITFATSSN
jgi:hypothetical protein